MNIDELETPTTAPRTNSIPDNLRVYQIPAAPGHDPITVYVEAIAPGQSRIIVRHYASSWTAYWGAHGRDITVEQFVCSCNIDYIADNLAWGLYGWLRRDGEKRMTVLLKKIAGAMQNHFKQSGAAI